MLNKSPREAFIERMGFLIQADGGPRIAGRILGLLIVEGKPFALQEMADRLQISKASASTNARLLASHGLLRQTSGSSRESVYELVPNPYRHLMENVEGKMRRAATELFESERLFADEDSGAKERVRQLAEFYQLSADFMKGWARKFPLKR